MATCTTKPNGTGKTLLLSWVPGCGDLDPKTTGDNPAWKVLGGISTKSIDTVARTATSNTDSSGAFTDTTVTGMDKTITFSGDDFKDIVDVSTCEELRDYIDTEILAGRQPSGWVRSTDFLHSKYKYFYVLATDNSQSAETEGVRTNDFNFTVTATNVTSNLAFQTEAIA